MNMVLQMLAAKRGTRADHDGYSFEMDFALALWGYRHAEQKANVPVDAIAGLHSSVSTGVSA